MKTKNKDIAAKYDAVFPGVTLLKWKDMVTKWKLDHTQPDPYMEVEKSVSIAETRLILAKEEAEDARKGLHAPHKITASIFIKMGLDIEEQQ